MAALIGHREAMTAIMPAEVWFVLSVILAPVGYVIQDAVADAMTVEAVPRVDDRGQPFDDATRKLMHTTMQTLGRVAIIGGRHSRGAGQCVCLHRRRRPVRRAEIVRLYQDIYLMALIDSRSCRCSASGWPGGSSAGISAGSYAKGLRRKRPSDGAGAR